MRRTLTAGFLLLSLPTATSQETSFDTILSTTCDGSIRLFPDNQLLNVNVDAPFIPRMFSKFVDGLRAYTKAKCGVYYNEEEFNQRFDIGRFILLGNKWFQGGEFRSDACFDDPTTFTRDGKKMYEALFTDQMEFDMPSTCNWNTWDISGSCAFEYSVRGIQDTTVQVRIERCSRLGGGYPRFSVGCRGSGCSGLTPCDSSSSCGAGQACLDVVDFVGKDNLINILTAVGYYKNSETAGDPRALIRTIISAFGGLFPGGVRTGSSVCLPKAIGNFNFNYDPWWWYPDLSLFTKLVNTYGGSWGAGRLYNAESRSDCNTATEMRYDPNYPYYQYVKYTTQWVLTNGLMNSWDGLVNGTSPLEPKSYWVDMPAIEYPQGENHVVSLQCDGVIHAFAGTAFPIRIYHPMLPDIIQFWAAQNKAAYPIPDMDMYLNNMAIWRLDPYLYTMSIYGRALGTFGNIASIFNPGFYLNATDPRMSALSIDSWRNTQQLDISLGLRRGWPNPLGTDFRANIRAGFCSGQYSTGLNSLHVTCVGEACREFLLARPCSRQTCDVGTCQTLDGYYTNDYVAQILWGNNDLTIPTPWAQHVTCAAGTSPGTNYRKLTTEQPIRGMLNGVWSGMQYADCSGRAADKCLNECIMQGENCFPVNGIPPSWNVNTGFCFPEVSNITSHSIYTNYDNTITFANIGPLPENTPYITEVVVDSPFPEPTNPVPEPPEAFAGVETLLTGSCDGQFRIFPENELLAISIDAQIVPRLFGQYMKAIARYVDSRCGSKGKTPPDLNDPTGRFMKRFHPLSYFVYSGLVDEYDSCLDDSDTFVRDFLKIFKENQMYRESLYLPETCNNVTWFEEGSCKMKIPLRLVPDAALTVNIERCDTNYGYIRFAVGCAGGGCNAIANPCNTDADCGGNSRCVNPIDEIGAEKVFNFFRDTLHYVGPMATQSEAVQNLFNDFVLQFGSYFKGSPIPGAGNKKVCFPKEYTSNPREHNSVDESKIIKERVSEDNQLCGLSGSDWFQYGGDQTPTKIQTYEINPGGMPGAGGKYYPVRNGMFRLVRGMEVTDTFNRPFLVGGGKCVTHDDCSTGGTLNLCMSGVDMCNSAGGCWGPPPSASDFKCACSVGTEIMYGYQKPVASATYGDMCQFTTQWPLYTEYETTAFAVPDVPTFTPWDGLLSDGKTQFERGDEWPHFPMARIPSGEVHVMSVQCNGLITFFEGTPFSIRLYLPKKQELLQFIADKYIASMSTWIPLGMDPSAAFNREQAPWRPEVYLSRLLSNTGAFPGFASIASEFWFGSSVLGMGDFTFNTFLRGKETGVGVSYNGMRYLLGDDFKANVRFQQCSAYPNGLVEMDVTCVGEMCQNLQLKKPCATGSRCMLGSCLSTHFYNNDMLAGALWGTDDSNLREYANQWSGATTCPATTSWGYIGVHETNNAKLFQTAASIYSLVITDDCVGRPQCACMSGCAWDGSSCFATATVDPRWEEQEINLCLPKLFPFPDAFIKDLGYRTGQIGKPDSANIYSVKKGISMDRDVTIYGIDANVEVIGAAQMVDVPIPDFSCNLNISRSITSGVKEGTDGGKGVRVESTPTSNESSSSIALIIAGAAVGSALLVLGAALFVRQRSLSPSIDENTLAANEEELGSPFNASEGDEPLA
eukprot:TRINITY_DN327_c0_g1_i7.p1 TRINITY_DN327_c0_g1~~TRINITY_DN327_c0_g1_i7.p1  ORF type:complete len:1644 (+),score=208.84 TRINITY_DN327_c0_g1_i7:56-4987(+)